MHKRIEIDGRPHWLFADGKVLPVVSGGDGDGDGGSGDKGGDGKGGAGDQSGKSGGDPAGSNMDPEGDGKGGDGGGDGQGGDGKPDLTKPMTLADFERIQTEREKTLFDRLADASGKQVKNALKDLNLGQKPDGDKGGDGKGGDKGGQGQPTQEDVARAAADRKRLERDSRSAFRDVLGNDVKFLGNAEREAAMNLGSALISQSIVAGEDDEEKIGSTVAGVVKGQIEALRKFYEDRTMAGLKRKGLLVETPGQRPQGGSQPQMDTAFASGKDKAAAMFGSPQSGNNK